jgi:peptidoglycan lytic transglycosylase G
VPGRTPEDRKRAAEERAARRAARERGEHYEPPPEPPRQPDPERQFQPLPSTRRAAVADRPPVSRAARAQRIGKPGRPTLPPSSPKPRRWFRRVMALLALLFIGAALYVINATFQPLRDEREQEGAVPVQIPPGADAGRIGRLLERKGVIEDARFFELNATLTLRRTKLRTGNYVLRRNMTNGSAIDALLQGPKVRVVKTFDVAVPEGLSRREAAPILDRSGVEGSYLRASGSDEARARARRLGLPKGTKTIEGFLFPATYELKAGASARVLVDEQLDAFRDRFGAVDLTRAKRMNLSRYDVVKIASLIERETPSDKERPLISSVIYNRLELGEVLGIDATIRYAENNWSRPLLRSQLEKDTPYNTRINPGLPPTPIGNPGLASLKAAAKPANTDYRFYVAKPGACHAFAKTNAQHERNVAAYEAAREKNGGKAPPQKC